MHPTQKHKRQLFVGRSAELPLYVRYYFMCGTYKRVCKRSQIHICQIEVIASSFNYFLSCFSNVKSSNNGFVLCVAANTLTSFVFNFPALLWQFSQVNLFTLILVVTHLYIQFRRTIHSLEFVGSGSSLITKNEMQLNKFILKGIKTENNKITYVIDKNQLK